MIKKLLTSALVLASLTGPAVSAEAPQTVGTFTASEKGFFANTFWLEGESGLILIDVQFLNSEASNLIAAIEKTGKKPSAVMITHPHPDHYNGLTTLTKRYGKLPVYATQATIDGIKATTEKKREFWLPTYGKDYPSTTIFPDQVLPEKGNVTIDGIEFVVDELGAGEASSITVFYQPQSQKLFVGDLSYPHMHPWLAEGRSNQWMGQLAYVLREYADTKVVYPGHGKAGSLKQLNNQLSYINTFQTLVRDRHASKGLTTDDKNTLNSKMKTMFPGYQLDGLIGWNSDAVATELATSEAH